MFWAEAVVMQVTSIVTARPVTSMPLTPLLKRVCRWIKSGAPHECRRRTALNSFGGGRKCDLRAPGVRCLLQTAVGCAPPNRPRQLVVSRVSAWGAETHGSVEFALQIAVAGVDDYRDADAIGQRT
jgi:hypothetical protein